MISASFDLLQRTWNGLENLGNRNAQHLPNKLTFPFRYKTFPSTSEYARVASLQDCGSVEVNCSPITAFHVKLKLLLANQSHYFNVLGILNVLRLLQDGSSIRWIIAFTFWPHKNPFVLQSLSVHVILYHDILWDSPCLYTVGSTKPWKLVTCRLATDWSLHSTSSFQPRAKPVMPTSSIATERTEPHDLLPSMATWKPFQFVKISHVSGPVSVAAKSKLFLPPGQKSMLCVSSAFSIYNLKDASKIST